MTNNALTSEPFSSRLEGESRGRAGGGNLRIAWRSGSIRRTFP